jgi:hypothetical protein
VDELVTRVIGISVSAISVMGAALVSVWRWGVSVGKTTAEMKDADCERRVTDLKERITALEVRANEGDARGNQWYEAWCREVQRGVKLRNAPVPPSGHPVRPPMPSWNEITEVRHQRALIEADAMNVELREYLESRPPPPLPPVRPRNPWGAVTVKSQSHVKPPGPKPK